MTQKALIAYGVGLIGLILIKILAPGFYARQDIKTPVRIAVGVLVATQLMNLLFVPQFAHAGLALSIGLGACVNAGFLFWGLRRRGFYHPHPGWPLFLAQLCGALLLMAGLSLWLASQFDWIALQASPLWRVGALALVLVLCAGAYFGALLLSGLRPGNFRRTAR